MNEQYRKCTSIYRNLCNTIIPYEEKYEYFEHIEFGYKSKVSLGKEISVLNKKIDAAYENMINEWTNLVKKGYFKDVNIYVNIKCLSQTEENNIWAEARKHVELTEVPYPIDTIAYDIWSTSIDDIHILEFEILGSPRTIIKINND